MRSAGAPFTGAAAKWRLSSPAVLRQFEVINWLVPKGRSFAFDVIRCRMSWRKKSSSKDSSRSLWLGQENSCRRSGNGRRWKKSGQCQLGPIQSPSVTGGGHYLANHFKTPRQRLPPPRRPRSKQFLLSLIFLPIRLVPLLHVNGLFNHKNMHLKRLLL